MRTAVTAFWLAAAICSCGCGPGGDSLEALNTRVVTLPGGRKVQAEVVTSEVEMTRGMMFRDSLAPDRGMLFIHGATGNYPYWMYQVRIPLDMLWMDEEHRIVEISAGTPPCNTKASQCPTYGGHRPARFVLELVGGMGAKYGLKIGDRLEF